VQGFIEEDINQLALCTLNECDLKALGFHKMGPRKLVMNSIEELKGMSTTFPLLCFYLLTLYIRTTDW